MELNWPQYGYPAACAITQQYSSGTFISFHFDSHKKEYGAHLKNFILFLHKKLHF
jgi:hypothetical protein